MRRALCRGTAPVPVAAAAQYNAREWTPSTAGPAGGARHLGSKRVVFFASRFAYSTLDPSPFVAAANAHITRMTAQGKHVGEAFLHALPVFLAALNLQQRQGGPFAAVVVQFAGGVDVHGQGIGPPRVLGVGVNHVVPYSDPSAHAEMEAMRDAAHRQGASDLAGAVLYTSCECCPMCLAVANGSGIRRLSYLATRDDAEASGFLDKQQYALCTLPRTALMTAAARLPARVRRTLHEKLGPHGAVVLNAHGAVVTAGDGATRRDPTGLASLQAVRRAVQHQAQQARAAGHPAPVWCLPAGWTLVCRATPHPAGLLLADWARLLRPRDPAHPDDPACDSPVPDPMRVIHLTESYEPLPVCDRAGQWHLRQATATTYGELTVPEGARRVRTTGYPRPRVVQAARAVLAAWRQEAARGARLPQARAGIPSAPHGR
jgi:guanine deaminase